MNGGSYGLCPMDAMIITNSEFKDESVGFRSEPEKSRENMALGKIKYLNLLHHSLCNMPSLLDLSHCFDCVNSYKMQAENRGTEFQWDPPKRRSPFVAMGKQFTHSNTKIRFKSSTK